MHGRCSVAESPVIGITVELLMVLYGRYIDGILFKDLLMVFYEKYIDLGPQLLERAIKELENGESPGKMKYHLSF